MIPISYQIPVGAESHAFEHNFSTKAGYIAGGALSGMAWRVAAMGQPIAGLHHEAVVDGEVTGIVRTKNGDFSHLPFMGPIRWRYQGEEITLAWDGLHWVQHDPRQIKHTLKGYRMGDVRAFKVPEWDSSHSKGSMEYAEHIEWPRVHLLSTRKNVIFGAELGEDQWLCSFGPGLTFRIRYANSTGSTQAHRKILFAATHFGRVPHENIWWNLEWHLGASDRATKGNVLITNTMPTTASYAFKLWDLTDDGQSCIIAVVPQSTGLSNTDECMMDAWPMGFCRVNFSLEGDRVKVSHGEILKTWNAGGTGASQMFLTGTTANGGTDGGGKLRNVQYNPPDEQWGIYWNESQVTTQPPPPNINTPTLTVFTGTTGTYQYRTGDPSPVPAGAQGGGVAINPPLGVSRGNGAYDVLARRVLTMAFKADKTLTTVTVLASRFTANNIVTTYQASIHGNGSHKRRYSGGGAIWNPPSWGPGSWTKSGGTCMSGSGGAFFSYSQKQESYSRQKFRLEIDGVDVDGISYEATGLSAWDRTFNLWKDCYKPAGTGPGGAQLFTIFYAWTSTNPADPCGQYSTENPVGKQQNLEPLHGRMTSDIHWPGLYNAIEQGGSISQKITDLGQPLQYQNGTDNTVKPVIILETAKIISFNLCTAGGTTTTIDNFSGTMPIKCNGMPSTTDKHYYRSVYNLYTGQRLKNQNIGGLGNSPNPAIDIEATKRFCTYNPLTDEGVLNSETQCTFIG